MYSLGLPSQQYQHQYSNQRSTNCCSSRSIWHRKKIGKEKKEKKEKKKATKEQQQGERLGAVDTAMAGLAGLLSGFGQIYTTYPVPVVATILPPTPRPTTPPRATRISEGRNPELLDTGRVQWSTCTSTTTSRSNLAAGINPNELATGNNIRSLSVDSGYQPRASFASSRPPTPFPSSLFQTPSGSPRTIDTAAPTTDTDKSQFSSRRLAKKLKACLKRCLKPRRSRKLSAEEDAPIFTYTPVSPVHPPIFRPHPGNPVIVVPSLDDDEDGAEGMMMDGDGNVVEIVLTSSSMSISSTYSHNSCAEVDGRTTWRRCPTLVYTSSLVEGRREGRESDATLVG